MADGSLQRALPLPFLIVSLAQQSTCLPPEDLRRNHSFLLSLAVWRCPSSLDPPCPTPSAPLRTLSSLWLQALLSRLWDNHPIHPSCLDSGPHCSNRLALFPSTSGFSSK